jgi:hypothetical protein
MGKTRLRSSADTGGSVAGTVGGIVGHETSKPKK